MRPFLLRAAGTLVLAFAFGCHMNISKVPAQGQDSSQGDIEPGFSVPSYTYVQTQVFQPYCISCHSNAGGNPHGVNLETFENTVQNLSDVETEALTNQTMPPSGPLPSLAQQILREWIAGGAPENGVVDPDPSPGPSPGPTPSPYPATSPPPTASPTPPPSIQPTYSSLAQNIFTPKCVACHSAGGSEASKPLDSYSAIMKYVTAGNPTGSAIYQKISSGKMPPSGPLSSGDIQEVETWIQNGAQNN